MQLFSVQEDRDGFSVHFDGVPVFSGLSRKDAIQAISVLEERFVQPYDGDLATRH